MGHRGYDGAKKTVGRKRHILVDTEGRLIELFVHDGDIQDPDGGRDVLESGKAEHPRLEKVWADGRYEGGFVDWAREKLGVAIEVVHRLADQAGFAVQHRRWVVERAFAWLGKYRRLSKDYEEQCETSESWIYAAMTHILVRRLARA